MSVPYNPKDMSWQRQIDRDGKVVRDHKGRSDLIYILPDYHNPARHTRTDYPGICCACLRESRRRYHARKEAEREQSKE